MRYADYVIERTEKFDELPPEEWRQLDDDIEHIHFIGDNFVREYGDKADTAPDRVLQFCRSAVQYLTKRLEIQRPAWIELGLAISRAHDDQSGEAFFLNSLGFVYSALGDKQQALDFYQQALPLFRAVGDRSGEATTLNNIGLVYSDLGDNQQALAYYQQALPLRRAVGDRAGEATTLNNIGAVYDALGDKQQALAYYQQAL
ncbi:MAG: tetratricopeptide repeat protein, partial [Alphaproteobacteria bacterium]